MRPFKKPSLTFSDLVASEPGHVEPLGKLFRFQSQLFLSLIISQAKLGTLMPVS